MFTLDGWQGMDWQEKVIVQNCPKPNLEGLYWLLNSLNELKFTWRMFGLQKQAATVDIDKYLPVPETSIQVFQIIVNLSLLQSASNK